MRSVDQKTSANPKNRKTLLIVLFCLIAVTVMLATVMSVLLLSRCSKAKAHTFDFTCAQYTEEMNKLLGDNTLRQDRWVVDKAVSVYTDDDFAIRLTTDEESQRVSRISVGPSGGERGMEMAAASLRVAEPQMDEQAARGQLLSLREKTLPQYINPRCIVTHDGEEQQFVISYNDDAPSVTDTTETTAATAATATVPTIPTEATAAPTAAPATAAPTAPTTAPTTAPPTEATTAPTTAPPEADWKALYRDAVNNYQASHGEAKAYALLEIDGDDIPELLIDSVTHMAGKNLYWVSGGELQTSLIGLAWGEVRYGAHRGVFWQCSNAQGAGYELYSFENGSLTLLHNAVYTTTGGLSYHVDGEKADEAAYNAMVTEITSQCSDEPVYYTSKSEILSVIDRY